MNATINDNAVKMRELADHIAGRLAISDPQSRYEVIERHQDSDWYINPAWAIVQKKKVPMPRLLRWLKRTRTAGRVLAVVDRWAWDCDSLCIAWDRETARIAAASIEAVGALGGVTVHQ